MISFDDRLGVYGREQGQGAKLRQFNFVSNWVWVLLIILLATVTAVFDKINGIDPEFFLFRAFVEVNSLENGGDSSPGVDGGAGVGRVGAGPLALENKEFQFANYNSDSTSDPGHIGFNPMNPEQTEVTPYQAGGASASCFPLGINLRSFGS